ncbi:HlyD family secretion protein [Pontimicrobium sp. MEBiC01747]
MNENNIFPEDILHNTVEYHIAKHSKKTNLIFWLLFLTLLGIFISLPFINIDVPSTSLGRVVSKETPVSIYTSSGGRITYFNIKENQTVSKGDTLAIISQKDQDVRDDLLKHQKEDILGFISDLRLLINGQHYKIKTNKYKKALLQYNQRRNNLNTVIEKAKNNYKRVNELYKKDAYTKVQDEEALFQLDKAKDDKALFISQAKEAWQIELSEYEQSLDNLNSNQEQLKEERNMKVVIAPVDGDLINVQAHHLGSLINPGSNLATISPSGNLIVESYMNPKDIGYIKQGIPVKYQVESYNSNQWGFATGEIIEVGKDIVVIQNTPVFKVRSSLNEKTLSLSNGVKGPLKKGMNVTSRFFLTNRTLFQLLTDSIDDWFNPYNDINE